jgi:tripartite-type tricarboxylate transporter receptor subunit TctC
MHHTLTPPHVASRRRVLQALAVGASSAWLALPRLGATGTDGFAPLARPIRWVVPFPPGGTSDLRARQVAERLRADLGWTIHIDNKPGASGMIGTDIVAKAAPDGHTLLLGTIGTLALNPHLLAAQQPYQVLRDLQPITQFSRSAPCLVAHRDVPANNLSELNALIRSGTRLAYASPGNATIGHLVGEAWRLRAQFDTQQVVHVPYAGTAPAVRDVVAGQVQLLVDTPSAVFEQLKSGQLKAIALASAERLAAVPQIGTFVEQGWAGFVYDTWQGALTRRGVPEAVLTTLHRELARALRHPEVVRSHEEQANTVVADTPTDFERTIATESARWGRLIAASGVRAG